MQREEAAAIAASMPVTAAPETLVTVTKVDQPPSDNTRTTYIDAEALAPEPPPVTPAVKYASLNNPNSVPTPAAAEAAVALRHRPPVRGSPGWRHRPVEERQRLVAGPRMVRANAMRV